MANAAVKNFDLHIAWRWFTSRDCSVSERSGCTGSGIGFGFVRVHDVRVNFYASDVLKTLNRSLMTLVAVMVSR